MRGDGLLPEPCVPDVTDLLVALVAGLGAGAMNAVVGAGTLITFPVLIALGLPPLVANVTSAVGIAPGNLFGAAAYRDVLLRPDVRRTAVTSTAALIVGALIGVPLLLVLPPEAFTAIVPWLILSAGVLTLVQPWLTRRMRGTSAHSGEPRLVIVFVGVLLAGVYLSYFGAATGVITLTVLLYAGLSEIQAANAIKNLAGGIANVVAAVLFLVFAPVDIPLAIAVALGAAVGGLLGGRLAQRLSPAVFRWVIVAVAAIAAGYVLLT